MGPIRILIGDDSAVARQVVSDAFDGDPRFEVVGTARNGRRVLDKLPVLVPDVVILDVDMPEMDGLEALSEIRRGHPRLPVLMLSAFTTRGAAVTVEALARGASDYVTKPTTDDLPSAVAALRAELTPRILQLCGRGERWQRPTRAPAEVEPVVTGRRRRPEVVAVGASTGGPNALRELLLGLGRDFTVPVAIVQHMPPTFTPLLAERLAIESGRQVTEAASGDVLGPGTVLLAPGDHHMTLVRTPAGLTVRLHQGPEVNSCRPSVDVLLQSIAETCGSASLAVILTGMGQDGLAGCTRIHQVGGRVLAQDEASSVVWGMPGQVVQAGLAHRVVPLEGLAGEIRRLAGVG